MTGENAAQRTICGTVTDDGAVRSICTNCDSIKEVKRFMDFALSEENSIFRDAIRNFAAQEIAPLVDESEETGNFPIPLFRKMGEMGFLCPRYPLELAAAGATRSRNASWWRS